MREWKSDWQSVQTECRRTSPVEGGDKQKPDEASCLEYESQPTQEAIATQVSGEERSNWDANAAEVSLTTTPRRYSATMLRAARPLRVSLAQARPAPPAVLRRGEPGFTSDQFNWRRHVDRPVAHKGRASGVIARRRDRLFMQLLARICPLIR